MSSFCCHTSRHPKDGNTSRARPRFTSTDDRSEPTDVANNISYEAANGATNADIPSTDLRGRASAVLSAVRNSVSRHLSRDGGLKRHSSITIGSSDEEVARRAELRRLRDKRIQEELKDDHGSRDTGQKKAKDAMHKPSFKSLAFIGGGPRDTIEFAVDKPQREEGKSVPSATATNTIKLVVVEEGGIKERNSPKQEASTKAVAEPQPTVNPIQVSQSQSSLIDQDDNHSGLGIWLASQDLHSRHSSATLSRNISHGAALPTKRKQSQPVSSTTSRDQEPDGSYMDAQNRGFCSSKDQHPPQSTAQSLNSQAKPAASKDSLQQQLPSDKSEPFLTQSPSEDLFQSYATAMAFTRTTDNGSSCYPSRMPSLQTSPTRSKSSLRLARDHGLDTVQLSPFEGDEKLSKLQDIEDSEGRSSYATALDGGSHDTQSTQKTTKEPATRSPSATPSFTQREIELQSIEKRFGGATSRKQSPTPRQSRFKEEFNKSSIGERGFPSLIPRILITRPGKLKTVAPSHSSALHENSEPDGASCADIGPAINISAWNTNYHCSSEPDIVSSIRPLEETYLGPELRDSATDLWQRAIRMESQQRRGLPLVPPMCSQGHTSERSRTSISARSTANTLDTQIHHSVSRSSIRSQVPLQSPQWCFPWKGVSLPIDTSGDIANAYGFPKLQPKYVIPPKSWAKYPSHTRDERNNHADYMDDVKAKDFAVTRVESDGNLHWTTNNPVAVRTLNPRASSFHGKLGKAFKSGLTKVFPPHKHPWDSASHALGFRRASSRLGDQTEPPNLEPIVLSVDQSSEPMDVAECKTDQRSISPALVGRDQGLRTFTSNSRKTTACDSEDLPDPLSFSVETSKMSKCDRENLTLNTEPISLGLDKSYASRRPNLPFAQSEPTFSIWPTTHTKGHCPRSQTWSGSLSHTRGLALTRSFEASLQNPKHIRAAT